MGIKHADCAMHALQVACHWDEFYRTCVSMLHSQAADMQSSVGTSLKGC